MKFKTKNNKTVNIRRLQNKDLENLSQYLQNLNEDSKKRFAPHPFDLPSIMEFYKDDKLHHAYITETIDTHIIIAYSIIKYGILKADYQRYHSYGLKLNNRNDCEFAPSVADAWQSSGIGNLMFGFILKELKKTAPKRIILWGGVQATNEKAVRYYLKHGFQNMGVFSHNGENFDMILEI